MKLLLFDIDLTLISTDGAGRRAMNRAFSDLFGKQNGLDQVSFAGRTDPAIFREGMAHLGEEWTQDAQNRFQRRYLDLLHAEVQKPAPGRHLKPGVPELLDILAERSDVTLALLTGNWAEGARIKLEHFNIHHYFEFGAFSDDSAIRSDLPGVAAARYREKYGAEINPSDVFVIGDTPRDVECARPFGAVAVAVATGFSTLEELSAAQPDFLFQDLSDADKFLALLEAS